MLSLGGLLASRFDRWASGNSTDLATEDRRDVLAAPTAELGH